MTPMLFFILVMVGVLSCALGTGFGYLYFKAKHRESAERLEAMWEQFIEKRRTLPKSAFADKPSEKAPPDTEALGRLRAEIEKRNREYKTLKANFETKTSVLRDEVTELKNQLAGSLEQRQQLELAAEDLTRKRDELEAAVRRLEAEKADVEASKQQALSKQANIDAVRQNVESARAQFERSKQQTDSQRAELEQAMHRIENERAELSKLQAQLHQREAELSAERDKLRQKESNMEGELEIEREKIRQKFVDVENELAAERERIREKAARVDEEIMSLPEGRFTSRQEALLIKRLRQEIRYLRDELESLYAQRAA